LKFYAKRRSLIFVLVPSLALEVACEVACAFSYSSRARPLVAEDACRLAKTCLLFSRPKLACCFPGSSPFAKTC